MRAATAPDTLRPKRRPPVTRSLPVAVLAFVTVSILAGCGARDGFQIREPGDRPPSGRVLTAAEIEASGARNAMEAIERGGTHLVIQRTSAHGLTITHRGVDSFALQPQVLVVVDGARVSHIESALRNIPAESIRYIEILSGREAALYYGAESGNGAVAIHTSARR